MKYYLFCICFIVLCCVTTVHGAAKNTNYYLKKASSAYNQGDYSSAEQAFRQLLKMRVSLHRDFYYFYGKTLFHNGHYKKSAHNLGLYTETVSNNSKYYTDAKRLLLLAEKKLAQKKPKKTRKKHPIARLTNVPEMIRISAGSFTMGSNHGSADQNPPHKVKLKNDFAIGKYEVTFSQYDVFAKASRQKPADDFGWGRGNRPVINVSLQNAQDYALWLSKKTNRNFRLPTEAEWEYVARTGFKKQLGFIDLLGLGDANCNDCRYFWESDQTMEVGSFDANKYGVHDLFGNVWEWTCSIYTSKYTGEERYCADKNDLIGKTMVVRGGGWNSFSAILRSYVRYNNFPNYFSNEQGFRLVEELE